MGNTKPPLVAVCSYSDEPGDGVFSYRFGLKDGSLNRLDAATARNAAFLTFHPTDPYLFVAERTAGGLLSSFQVDREQGTLSRRDHRGSRGIGPGYLSFDGTGRHLFAANCAGDTVAVFPVSDDGALGEATTIVEHAPGDAGLPPDAEPHPHAVRAGPDNRFVYVPDMGLDRIFVYEFDPDDGTLAPALTPPVELAAGAGPRHMDFHSDGRFAYVINENDSTITTFERDPEVGSLTPLQTVGTLPAGFDGKNKTADIHVHPSGEYLYGSNRGHDSIAAFAIGDTGRLDPLGHTTTGGSWPRDFGIDPSGRYLYAQNQGTDDIVVFAIDPDTGRLTATGDRVSIDSPVCLAFGGAKHRNA